MIIKDLNFSGGPLKFVTTEN